MLIIANRELRFTGYGLRLMPGENRLTMKVPHGLHKSLLRHEKAGALRIVNEEVAALPLPVESVPRRPANHQPPTGKRKKHRR
jgi:hypothetical protein